MLSRSIVLGLLVAACGSDHTIAPLGTTTTTDAGTTTPLTAASS